jgi:outer membrane protein
MLNLLPLILAAATATNSAPALSLEDAVLLALRNNRGLAVEKLQPEIIRTAEGVERAAFDPVVAGEAAVSRDPEGDDETVTAGLIGAAQRLPTGTRLEADVSGTDSRSADPGPSSAGASVTLTQSLLQGRPLAANLAALRQAEIDTAVSEYELRGFAEALVADVEIAYWSTVLSQRRLTIVEEALAVAERQLFEIDHRIRVGGLPETERASAQAEVALRREALINARGALALTNLRLKRLINPAALTGAPGDLNPSTQPFAATDDPDPLAVHVEAALRRRPDLNQARLQIKRGDLELIRTRNGLLPKLDLFARLGDTGYARSFGRAAGELDGENPEYSVGVRMSFPPLNREAKALQRRAELSLDQTQAALLNLEDLARVEVEAAYIEAQRIREQIAATVITRQFQEEKLRAEQAKYRVGRSTSLLVAQAQQDLVNSQVSEVDAAISGLQALVRLYRLEGTLLERRGLSAPGRE